MDQTQLQQKIAEYYQKLPEETKVLFASMSWLETLKSIGLKYSLNEEQVKTLGTETTLVLLGIINPDDYKQTLRTDIKLETNKIDELIKEVEDKIVKDVEPSLYETFNKNIIALMEENNIPTDDSYKQKIYEIGTKYRLPIDKMGEIEEVTEKFIAGRMSASQYEQSLSLITDLPPSRVTLVINDINENIIKDIRNSVIGADKKTINKDLDIPLPPYKAITSDKLLITEEADLYKKDEVETIKENPVLKNEEIDAYKGHGIEIIKEEDPSSQINEESIKSGFEKSRMSILAEKLSGSTLSKTTVSDYSLPKMKTQTEASSISQKVHDPYHEAI